MKTQQGATPTLTHSMIRPPRTILYSELLSPDIVNWVCAHPVLVPIRLVFFLFPVKAISAEPDRSGGADEYRSNQNLKSHNTQCTKFG